MHRRLVSRVLVIMLAASAVATWGAGASADTSRVSSEPNRDIGLTVSVGCQGTNRDKDNDQDTCTNGDTAALFFAVFNQSDVTQTIRIDYVLDGPGTELDHVFTKDVVLEPDDGHQERDELRVKKATPLGEYTLTVTASGSETASTSASATVQPKN